MGSRRARTLAALLLLLTGCGAPPALLAPDVAVAVPPSLTGSAGFDAPAGVGADAAAIEWRIDDRVLYEVTYNEPAGRRVWYVEARYADPQPASADEPAITYTWSSDNTTTGERFELSTLGLVVLEAGSERVQLARGEIPCRLMQRGLYEGCRRYAALIERYGADAEDIELSKEDERSFANGMFALFSMLRIVKSVDELREVLYTVVEKPSLLSIALHLGVKLNISAGLDEGQAVDASLPPPLEGVPAYEFPAYLSLNGDPALDLVIRACPTTPPLHVCAGITFVRGTHPEDPERWMEIRLIGARRGAEAPAPRP